MWEQHSTLLIRKSNTKQTYDKICAFDLDHTLVCQKSGKKFPIDENDWKLLYPNIKEKIQILSQEYTLVLFTNQNGIKKGKVTKESFQNRVENIINELQVEMWCFAATHDDYFRKPGIGMWDFASNLLNISCKKQHFYVGDAAGRIKGWKKGMKKDFSCSDRKFGYNIKSYYDINMLFKTPEEFFLEESLDDSKWDWCSFDVTKLPEMKTNFDKIFESNDQEMVILIGPPASGKSRLSAKFPNYVRVNRDTLKTKTKCLKLAEKSIKEGKSVVIDNTNPDIVSRKPYIEIAEKNGLPVRCIVMKIEKDFANHLNNVRVQIGRGKNSKIPMVVYHTYFKKFNYPSQEEGFVEIIETNFLEIGTFDSENDKKLYMLKY